MSRRQASSNAVRTAPTPDELLRRFGARSTLAREGTVVLLKALAADGRRAFARWKESCGHLTGRGAEKLPRMLDRTAARFGSSAPDADPMETLFALQTYYALLVEEVAARFASRGSVKLLPDGPFNWAAATDGNPLARFLDRLREEVAACRRDASSADGSDDLFKPLYQNIFPRPLRRRLGEYYTPDWLAEHVLDCAGYDGDPTAALLDPACGSGTFLLRALRRWRNKTALLGWRLNRRSNREAAVPAAAKPKIVGFDLNPLAVLTARANYLLAAADLPPDAERMEIPVYHRDAILDESDDFGPFDFVVGNPPWIAWDDLTEEARRATKPLWRRYGLFSLSGNEARHGGGKKDLAMLMLYAAADKYLKEGGRLAMVVTQTAFQSVGAGDGFRRFRLGPDGAPLKVERVDDLTALRPFADAANWTSTILLRKGAVTQYPVQYMKWVERREGKGKGGKKREGRTVEECFARPIDSLNPNSPWLVLPKNALPPLAVSQESRAFTAHLGANSGGANGVFWLEVLEHRGNLALVRNLPSKGKRRVKQIEAEIEPDLLYPLLRWGDLRRYRAEPRYCILLAQDPQTRTGIDLALMKAKFPRSLAYLERFADPLVGRAAYRRYQRRGPFYSMYNVGPYTVAPIKVVWRRMDRRINAAVVESYAARPPIPQETCVLVACNTADEAHYLCATLNSAPLGKLIEGHSVRGGKGFGTPAMLDFLPIERFNPADPRHVELSRLSRAAHAAAENENALDDLQRRMDKLS